MEERKLGKYYLRTLIGRGAAGSVYEAWDPVIHRRVAIKMLTHMEQSLDEEYRARFRREVQAAGRLAHTNIVNVYDFGETAETAYIVMQHIDGISLDGLLRRLEPGATVPLHDVGRIMGGLLCGLQHSHEHGVVHRDIKPGNVLLATDGSVKITDYGIAHLDNSVMTQAGDIIGTPSYMAPEQVGGGEVDRRTDIYAAGVVLYEMLTGRRPFEGSSASIMNHILHTPPPPPSQVAMSTLPAGLDQVVLKALEKRPEDRFQSATEFARALHVELDRVGAGMPMSALASLGLHNDTVVRAEGGRPTSSHAARQPRVSSKSRVSTWLGLAIIAVLLIIGSVWLLPNRQHGWDLVSGFLSSTKSQLSTYRFSNAAPASGRLSDEAGNQFSLEMFNVAMQKWVDAHLVPAASLAVMRQDRLVLARGYGRRKAGDRVPIWSLSKPITAACLVTFINEKRIAFTDPIIPLLTPAFWSSASQAVDNRWGDITIGDLVSHRSGLPGRGIWGGFAPGVRALLERMAPEQLRVDLIAPLIKELPLQATPGNRFDYSNINYLLLGDIIEGRAGKPYVDACRERVLDRVGVSNASLDPRWGGLSWASGGWSLSGPEYLAFMRLLEPRDPDPLGVAGRSWLNEISDKWIDTNHKAAYTLGVSLFPQVNGLARIGVGGTWYWKQDQSASGPINEQSGTLAALLADGTAWFVSFDGISSDTNSQAVRELDDALTHAYGSIPNWPDHIDLFSSMGISQVRGPSSH